MQKFTINPNILRTVQERQAAHHQLRAALARLRRTPADARKLALAPADRVAPPDLVEAP